MFTLHCCLCTAGCGPCSVAFKTAMLVQGDLRIAHCGGFHSNLDRLITAFNVLAKLLHHNIRWDSETIGCEPSLSSIPAAEQRTLLTAMQELADWLAMPQNEKEFLIVFFDDQMDLASWVSNDVSKPRWQMPEAHMGHALRVKAPQAAARLQNIVLICTQAGMTGLCTRQAATLSLRHRWTLYSL